MPEPSHEKALSVPTDQEDDDAFLATLDVITANEAVAAGLAIRAGTVQQVKLENENRAVVQGVEILTDAGEELEVKVDAETGLVVHMDS